MSRPWFCLEQQCTPMVVSHDHKDIRVPETGKSVFCWGHMPKPIEFTYDGVPHCNDCSLCIYTPLKGVFRLQVNKEDVELFKIGAERMLQKIEDMKT